MSDYIWSRVEEKIDLLLERAGINWEEKKKTAPPPRELSEAEKQARANAPATPSADQLQTLNPTEAATIQATPPPATPAVTFDALPQGQEQSDVDAKRQTSKTEEAPPKTTTTTAKG